MWFRQHKMHLGKWHVKTFLLTVTLGLVVFLYLRVQTATTEGLEGEHQQAWPGQR